MKNNIFSETTLSQVDRRLEGLRSTQDKATIRGGWIKYMRKVLGLTMQDLAALVSLPASNIAQAEKREIENKITLELLRRLANAMDCDVVYSFVPRKNINTLIYDKAIAKARKLLENADHHMKLEDQKVATSIEERIERLAKKFIDNGDIW